MSNLLPAVPKRGAKVSARQVADIERQIAENLSAIDDVESLDEWRARARALEMYLRDKELKGPMAGASVAPRRGSGCLIHHRGREAEPI